MMAMKAAALLLWVFCASFVSSAVSVSADSCQWVPVPAPVIDPSPVGAGLLERCGDQLRSFALKTADPKWRERRDMHGVFYFTCMNEPKEPSLLAQFSRDAASMGTPCPDEPGIWGSFISAEKWQRSKKDENSILDAWEGNYWQDSIRPRDHRLLAGHLTCRLLTWQGGRHVGLRVTVALP